LDSGVAFSTLLFAALRVRVCNTSLLLPQF
jgi:hypothetical protein